MNETNNDSEKNNDLSNNYLEKIMICPIMI